MINRKTLKNIEEVLRWVMESWKSIGNVEQMGFGFYLLHVDAIVSWSSNEASAATALKVGFEQAVEHLNCYFNLLAYLRKIEELAARVRFDSSKWRPVADNGIFRCMTMRAAADRRSSRPAKGRNRLSQQALNKWCISPLWAQLRISQIVSIG